MKIHIVKRGDVDLPPSFKVTVKQVILEGVKFAKTTYPKNAEISVVFVPETEMAKLNLRFKNLDVPTDVLSFPAFYELTGVLGDIIICPCVAAKQAKELGHTYEREIAFLTAHGLLHLLGFSHIEPDDEKIMIKTQKEILNKVGIPR